MANILVIDDDPMAREFIAEALSQTGHHIATASNGRQGLALFGATPFDLVITDIIMPDVEGIETIMQLKREKPGVRIIAISGGGKISAYSHLSLAEKFGVKKTLAKPFGKADLFSAVNEVLEL